MLFLLLFFLEHKYAYPKIHQPYEYNPKNVAQINRAKAQDLLMSTHHQHAELKRQGRLFQSRMESF